MNEFLSKQGVEDMEGPDYLKDFLRAVEEFRLKVEVLEYELEFWRQRAAQLERELKKGE